MVMNALDNRSARNHVNRLCLAADIPLVESGTAGYLGQVTVRLWQIVAVVLKSVTLISIHSLKEKYNELMLREGTKRA